MKNDKLLKAFNQKEIKAQKKSLLSVKKGKNICPIDSGSLVAIKGGYTVSPIKGN